MRLGKVKTGMEEGKERRKEWGAQARTELSLLNVRATGSDERVFSGWGLSGSFEPPGGSDASSATRAQGARLKQPNTSLTQRRPISRQHERTDRIVSPTVLSSEL